MFSTKDDKFDVVKSFRFGGYWPNDIRAFKLLDEGAYLFFLMNHGACAKGDEDPLDGSFSVNNLVRIYDLKSGFLVGEQMLTDAQNTLWTVDFSEDGRQLRVASNSSTHIFDLIAVRWN